MDLRYLPSISPVLLGNFNITLVAMNSLTSLLVIGSLAFQTVLGLPGPSKTLKAREAELLKRSVDSFIATESPIALTDLLCNIGSTGACVPGASSGIVIASPDSTNPDCNDIPI
jgi:glucoamylase